MANSVGHSLGAFGKQLGSALRQSAAYKSSAKKEKVSLDAAKKERESRVRMQLAEILDLERYRESQNLEIGSKALHQLVAEQLSEDKQAEQRESVIGQAERYAGQMAPGDVNKAIGGFAPRSSMRQPASTMPVDILQEQTPTPADQNLQSRLEMIMARSKMAEQQRQPKPATPKAKLDFKYKSEQFRQLKAKKPKDVFAGNLKSIYEAAKGEVDQRAATVKQFGKEAELGEWDQPGIFPQPGEIEAFGTGLQDEKFQIEQAWSRIQRIGPETLATKPKETLSEYVVRLSPIVDDELALSWILDAKRMVFPK